MASIPAPDEPDSLTPRGLAGRRVLEMPTEQTIVTAVAAVVGVFAGLTTGLLANCIVLFQLLFFRSSEVLRLLFGKDSRFEASIHGELASAPWHFEYLVFGGVVFAVAWLVRPFARRFGLRLTLFDQSRLRFVGLLLGFGLILYYPLLALASLVRALLPAQGTALGLMGILALDQRWQWVLVPALGGLAVGLLETYVAPFAGGHGVVEVMEAVRLDEPISGRVAFWKPIMAGLTIGTGGSCGREGPVVHMGAALGSSVGRRLGLSRDSRAVLLAAGAAAGIAASFNAPIAGTTFALEIVLGDFGVRAFSPIVLAAVMATVTAHSLIGQAGGEVARVTYSLVSSWEIAGYALLGILCGLGSVAYAKTVGAAERFFAGEGFMGSHLMRIPLWLRPMAGGLLVGLIALAVPQVLGNGYESMNAALYAKLGLTALLLIFVAKLLGTGSTLGSGAPGGSFFPAVFLGAMLGGAFGTVMHHLAPLSTGGAGAYAAVGMGALVAGATLAPLTGILMIFELTGNYLAVPPLMVACGLSAVTMQWLLGGSMYGLKLQERLGGPRVDNHG